MRPPPDASVFDALASLFAEEPELAAAVAAQRAPEPCPPGHLFCPTCGQLHQKSLLMRLVIYTPESAGPQCIVSSGLLCSFPQCMQPIWTDGVEDAPAGSGATEG